MTYMKDETGNIIAQFNIQPGSYYRFEVDTLWGNKEYELKPTYHFISSEHKKDYSKPSGMVLTKA